MRRWSRKRNARRQSLPGDPDELIGVYRRHAARAITEERWAAAEIFLDRILEVDHRNTEAWLMKGHLRHHCRENLDGAVECYRKVLWICGPGSDHAHAQRAREALQLLLGQCS